MWPAELLRRVYEWYPGAGHHATFDVRTAQAMACVDRLWARHARVEILVHRLTVRGRLRPGRGGVYSAPNQISTYEMLVRLQRHYRLSNDQIASLDRDLAARHAAGDLSCTRSWPNGDTPCWRRAASRWTGGVSWHMPRRIPSRRMTSRTARPSSSSRRAGGAARARASSLIDDNPHIYYKERCAPRLT